MPSTSSRGWNPAPRPRPWPFRTPRNIVVTTLFTVALVAALFGVGTAVVPAGPRDDATGLTGSASDAPTTSETVDDSSEGELGSGEPATDAPDASAPSTGDPQALPGGSLPDGSLPDGSLPDDVAPPLTPIPLPGSRPLGTPSAPAGAYPGSEQPVTPPPGFDQLAPGARPRAPARCRQLARPHRAPARPEHPPRHGRSDADLAAGDGTAGDRAAGDG